MNLNDFHLILFEFIKLAYTKSNKNTQAQQYN